MIYKVKTTTVFHTFPKCSLLLMTATIESMAYTLALRKFDHVIFYTTLKVWK